MPNKFFNKQVTYPVTHTSSKGNAKKGVSLQKGVVEHKDPWPGPGGPIRKWPERSGWPVAKEHPIQEGME